MHGSIMHWTDVMRRASSMEDTAFYTHMYNGVTRHWAVGLLVKDPRYLALEIGVTDVDFEWAAQFPHIRGVEKHRVSKLLRVKGDFEPVTYIDHTHSDPPYHLLIDGQHRYYASFLMGRRTIPVRMTPRALWEEYVLDQDPVLQMFTGETPEELQKSFSGLT